MSLFFLHPAYLYGLIAASLPIVIHLLNRRRVKRIRFPAVRFLLLTQKRISRTTRLRHWLLLALRTLAVILLVFLLAHPIFQTGAGLLAGGGSSTVALVLDNSLSMKWTGNGDELKQAKAAASFLLSSLKEGDRAAVIPTNGQGNESIRLKRERQVLLRELEGVSLADGGADLTNALKKAYELLKEPAAEKEIWIITDMALTDWDRFRLSAVGQYDPLIPIKVIKATRSAGAVNATVKEVKLRGQEVSVGVPIQVQVTLANFSDAEIRDLLVQLHIDERPREQRLVSLPPRGESEVSFQFVLTSPGPHSGAVTIKKERVAGNDTVHFALQAEDKLKVLVVDGDPQTALVQSETFFLTRALNPGTEGGASPFLPTVVIPDGLAGVALDGYRVVVLCNVPSIPDATLARLREYIRQGGGALVFLGDRVQASDYNARLFDALPSILPARLREKRALAEGGGEKIEKIDLSHPAFAPFADEILRESLSSVRVRGYFRVESPAGPALVSLANGDPLVVEKKFGAGRLLLVNTAADRDWSDLPLKTAYLPLVQSLIHYLQGGRKGSFDGGIAVGGVKEFPLPASYVGKSLKIILPDRRERETPINPDKEKAAASFQENDRAGIYRPLPPASADGQAAIPSIYAVNAPFLESRLETISDNELAGRLSPIRTEIIPIESLDKGGKRTDLALSMLLLLIVTLGAEGWLSQRFYG
jgi:hypothetical protein